MLSRMWSHDFVILPKISKTAIKCHHFVLLFEILKAQALKPEWHTTWFWHNNYKFISSKILESHSCMWCITYTQITTCLIYIKHTSYFLIILLISIAFSHILYNKEQLKVNAAPWQIYSSVPGMHLHCTNQINVVVRMLWRTIGNGINACFDFPLQGCHYTRIKT